jgi:hypothetical protein
MERAFGTPVGENCGSQVSQGSGNTESQALHAQTLASNRPRTYYVLLSYQHLVPDIAVQFVYAIVMCGVCGTALLMTLA